MDYNDLSEVVANLKGAVTCTLDTETSVKLKGGKKNPMQGRVTKRTRGAKVTIYSDMEFSPYETRVKAQMLAEGKDPKEFSLKPRPWGTRVGTTPFIENKGNHYLEVIYEKAGTSAYYLDGEYIDPDDIEGLGDKPELNENAQGGIEEKVILRTFALESLSRILFEVDGRVFEYNGGKTVREVS